MQRGKVYRKSYCFQARHRRHQQRIVIEGKLLYMIHIQSK